MSSARRRGGDERGYHDRGGHHAGYSSGYGASKAGGSGLRDRDTNAWHQQRHNGSSHGAHDPGIPLPLALQGIEEATDVSEWAFRCVAAVLEGQAAGRGDAERALSKLVSLLSASADRQVLPQLAGSALPGAVVRSMRKFRSEPPAGAQCCVAIVRSAGSPECSAAYVRAGALEEVGAFMDQHQGHGGVQNVCLLALAGLLKDSSAARQAVSLGTVSRVLQAMEATTGREVQYNALSLLRLLTENGRAQRAGLQEAALRAKVAHQNDTALCKVANDVLALVTPRFKEVLCWHWQSGWCKLGPRCTYAHGPGDLRPH